MSVEGRVTVITGATGGLGRVAAPTFAQHGASLALLSSDQSKLDVLAAELTLPAERVLTHAADLRDPAAVERAAQAVVEKFGAVHILLHLVGGWAGGKTLTEMAAEDLKSMLDQHVWTTFHLLRAFAPHLTASGWGRVIVVSSPLVAKPAAKMGAYTTAKAAEEALTLTLAQEVKDKGVTANVLHVRAIDTEHKREREPSPSNASRTTPEEIVAAMLYLCSPEAGVVNGTRLGLAGA